VRTVTSDRNAALPLLKSVGGPVDSGGLSLRRSDERLHAELPALACPATVAISSKNAPNGASGTGPGKVGAI
jgi:hypothetical protein